MNTAAEGAGRAAAFGAGAAVSYSHYITAVLGVPLNVVVAASLGVLAGLAWNDADKTRRQLVGIALGSMVSGCAVTALANAALHFYKVTPEPTVLAPAALLIAFFGPRWVPAVNDRIGPWLDKIPFIGKGG